MSTDLTHYQANSGLAIAPEQTTFTEQQRAILQHMGVEDAPEADLQVFMHQCQRTGLDPFARQIHMIGRNSKNQRTQQWETKYTIQTGIDGYRVIGHRSAERSKATVSVGAAEWCNAEGRWLHAWSKAWGTPIAARVTIRRNGEPFTATANFDEYAQTKRDGGLTQMWTQRGAGQLAKCAEALAWRMAFPHDLAGVYLDEEMQHADAQPSEAPVATAPRGLDALRAAAQPEPAEDVQDAEVEPDEPADPLQARTRARMFALLTELGITDETEQKTGMSRIVGRTVESRATLTQTEGQAIVDHLEGVKLQRDIDAVQQGQA